MSRAGIVTLGFLLASSTVCMGMPGATNAPAIILPEKSRKLAAQGESAFADGNLQEAESLYKKALESGAGSPPLLVSLAATETRLGKIAESDSFLRQALRIDLNNGPAWLLLGMNALSQKRDEEALADLAQASLHDPANPRAHNYLGMAAGRKGWNEASEQELSRAVELDPNYADANFNLAVLYLRRTPALIELAHRHYQRAIDLGAARDPLIEGKLAKAVASPTTDDAPSAPNP